MPEFQFVLDFVPENELEKQGGTSDLPDDTTLANFAIYVRDDCLTRNRPRRLRLAQTKDTVFGPVAGLAEWLIENWAPILWETRTPFKNGRTADEEDVGGPPIPGVKEAVRNWEGYIYKDCDLEEMADWQHRHLLGHASSDLALPSITIVPEDNSVVLAVGGLPSEMGATVDFALPSDKPGKSAIFVVRKIDFRQEAVNLIESTLQHAALSGRHSEWIEWLTDRWQKAQKDEANPGRQLFWMLGDLGARRVEELEPRRPELASALRQLLLDCRAVTQKLQLIPLEGMLDQYAVGNAHGSLSNRIARWQSVPTEAVSTSQPVFTQGYRLADLVRQKLALSDRPIREHAEILESLDVKLESYCDTELFQTAACAERRASTHYPFGHSARHFYTYKGTVCRLRNARPPALAITEGLQEDLCCARRSRAT